MKAVHAAMLVAALASPAGLAHAALSRDDFTLRNTGDLVSLCGAQQDDPLYTPAVNFCHGFAVGVVRVLQDAQTGHRSRRRALFCLPAQMPSRNEGIAQFVQWARADQSRMALPAEEGVAAFLTQQYPCSGAQ